MTPETARALTTAAFIVACAAITVMAVVGTFDSIHTGRELRMSAAKLRNPPTAENPT